MRGIRKEGRREKDREQTRGIEGWKKRDRSGQREEERKNSDGLQDEKKAREQDREE